MEPRQLARILQTRLQLDTRPAALAFVDSPPEGVVSWDGEVPSACAFWRKAESGAFYAAAEKHFNCPIGAMTMGFDLPEPVQMQLAATVETMGRASYLSSEEPAHLPAVPRGHRGIVYGRLENFPGRPDLILMWLSPAQAMLYSEAVGDASWSIGQGARMLGRPACAALPMALKEGRSTFSLGCVGMRTFTEISGDRLLAVLPGEKAEELAGKLASAIAANDLMRARYQEHKSHFPP